MPRKSKAQLAKEAEAAEAKRKRTPKEIRLKRRAEEKLKFGITTDIPNYQEFKIKTKITPADIQSTFTTRLTEYIPLVRDLVASNLAFSSAINNVMTAAKELHSEIGQAEELHNSIDTAWDLAASSLILEAAFSAAGYAKEEARVFAQAIMLKREEPRPIHVTKPLPEKKTPDVEALVNDVATKLGLVLSRTKDKPEAPTPKRTSRKQS